MTLQSALQVALASPNPVLKEQDPITTLLFIHSDSAALNSEVHAESLPIIILQSPHLLL